MGAVASSGEFRISTFPRNRKRIRMGDSCHSLNMLARNRELLGYLKASPNPGSVFRGARGDAGMSYATTQLIVPCAEHVEY